MKKMIVTAFFAAVMFTNAAFASTNGTLSASKDNDRQVTIFCNGGNCAGRVTISIAKTDGSEARCHPHMINSMWANSRQTITLSSLGYPQDFIITAVSCEM